MTDKKKSIEKEIRGKKVSNAFVIKPASRHNYAGRDPSLIKKRNLHLLYRFAWYSNDARNSFPWIIKQLAREFYLSEYTVGKILQGSSKELYAIRDEAINIKSLRRKYPFFDWEKGLEEL